jgi:glycerol-3-phosphate cytidylyltransferase-like family protein
VVVVYSGRFQPFHPGHYSVYTHLVKKFGKENIFIGTSDLTDTNKSPFSFDEKSRIINTMFGIDIDKIVLIKNPYKPTEILSKFNPQTTAYISVIGEKDSNRLGGNYYKPYNGIAHEGYDICGYVYTVPMKENGISATDVRRSLENGSDKTLKLNFIKIYNKFNEDIFRLIIGKLGEIKSANKKLIELSANSNFGVQSIDQDDGPGTFSSNWKHYYKQSKLRAKKIGYTALEAPDENSRQRELVNYRELDPRNLVTNFPIMQEPKNTDVIGKFAAKRAYTNWRGNAMSQMYNLGWSLVNTPFEKEIELQSIGDGNENIEITQEGFPSGDGSVFILPNGYINGTSEKNIVDKMKNKLNKERKKYKNSMDGYIHKSHKNENEMQLNEIPMSDLVTIDKYADSEFAPVDVVITDRHFFERLKDPRNRKEITAYELIGFFKRLARDKDKFLNFLNKYKQIVATDNRTNINIPFMKVANKAIAKTIMRKNNFMTSNPIYKFEDKIPGGLSQGLNLTDIANKHKVDIDDIMKEFANGVKVEMEHTTNIEVAEEIALDHLFEDPNYYTKLAKIERNNEYAIYRTHIQKPVDTGGLNDKLNELTKGEIFGGRIKISGVSVPLEVELLGADNKKKVFVTRVIDIDKKYSSKLPSNGILEIPAKFFRMPCGGWYKIKTVK